MFIGIADTFDSTILLDNIFPLFKWLCKAQSNVFSFTLVDSSGTVCDSYILPFVVWPSEMYHCKKFRLFLFSHKTCIIDLYDTCLPVALCCNLKIGNSRKIYVHNSPSAEFSPTWNPPHINSDRILNLRLTKYPPRTFFR